VACGSRHMGRIFRRKKEKATRWYSSTTRSFFLVGLLSPDIKEVDFRIRRAGRVENAWEMRSAYIILVQRIESILKCVLVLNELSTTP
jgi:hypothetical protein